MNEYNTLLQETFEKLKIAGVSQDNCLLNNEEIKYLLSYVGSSEREINRQKYLLKAQGTELRELYIKVDELYKTIDKAKKLIGYFKLTEWGMNGYEPLDSIQNILNENEVSK